MKMHIEPKFKKYGTRFLILMILVCISTLATIYVSAAIREITNATADGMPILYGREITRFGVVICIISLIRFLSWKTELIHQNSIEINVYGNVHEKMLTIDLNYFITNSAHMIISVINNDVPTIAEYYGKKLYKSLADVIIVISSFSYLFYMNMYLALVTIIALPLLLFLSNTVTKHIQTAMFSQKHIDDEITNLSLGFLSNIEIAKVSEFSNIIQLKLFESIENRSEIEIKNQKLINTFMIPVSILAQIIPYCFCYCAGGILAYYGHLIVGDLIAFLAIASFMVRPMSRLPQDYQDFKLMNVSKKRLNSFMGSPDRSIEKTLKYDPSMKELVFELNNIYFKYQELQDNATLIINHMQVKHREKIAIIGQSGSGKSTLGKIMAGILRPDLGYAVHSNTDFTGHRGDVLYISQNPFIIPGSIIENISCQSLPNVEDEHISNILDRLNMLNIIKSFPDIMLTDIGEGNRGLSGGQAQRIGIARALFHSDNAILIADEPTANLDQQNAKDTIEALLNSNAEAVVVILHDRSLLSYFDRVIMVEAGQIVMDEQINESIIERLSIAN